MKRFLFAACAVLLVLGCGGENVEDLFCLTCGDDNRWGGNDNGGDSEGGSSSRSSTPSSSSVGGGIIYGTPVTYEGETYQTVVIGAQTWMAENLNYNVSGSKCYDNLDSNCEIYGRLYDWSTARTVCPSGWHLPSQAEWNTLSSYVQSDSGCSSCDARLLKATSGWNSNGNGTDAYGFSALPGGAGYSGRIGSEDGSFINVGNIGLWWSASQYGVTDAYYRYYNGEYAYWYYKYKSDFSSVRCVKD